VDNYARQDGIIRQAFQPSIRRTQEETPEWRNAPAESVQAAYFAQKRRKGGEVELLDSSESGDKKEDQVAYDLIMRDKESLLSFPADW